MAKQRGLGRGLGALIKEVSEEEPEQPEEEAVTVPDVILPPVEQSSESDDAAADSSTRLPVAEIVENPWQPRKHFEDGALEDLVQSIRVHGVLQPLIVRPTSSGYQLIAGERRFRAAQEAGLEEVPVIVRDLSDREALELALIENLQREDLNPIEEAEGYEALIQEFQLTQGQVADQVGKGRTTVANALRLLEISSACKEHVRMGALSVGHAKVLLGLKTKPEQDELAAIVLRDGLSVRATEAKVAQQRKPEAKPRKADRSDLPKAHLKDLTERLQHKLGTGARIIPSKTLPNGKKAKGRVEIDFYSPEDLDRLLEVLQLNEPL